MQEHPQQSGGAGGQAGADAAQGFDVQCTCGSRMRVEASLRGKVTRCRACNRRVLAEPAATRPADPHIHVHCDCGQRIRATPAMAGKRGRCPNCRKLVLVPRPVDPTAPEAIEEMAAEDLSLAGSTSDQPQPGDRSQVEAATADAQVSDDQLDLAGPDEGDDADLDFGAVLMVDYDAPPIGDSPSAIDEDDVEEILSEVIGDSVSDDDEEEDEFGDRVVEDVEPQGASLVPEPLTFKQRLDQPLPPAVSAAALTIVSALGLMVLLLWSNSAFGGV